MSFGSLRTRTRFWALAPFTSRRVAVVLTNHIADGPSCTAARVHAGVFDFIPRNLLGHVRLQDYDMAEVTAAGSSWVQHLAVLPAKLRLEFQKTINADVTAQASIAPQPPLSRAYSSGGERRPTGMGATGSALDSIGMGAARTSAGKDKENVSRKFDSTAEVLAGMILSAAKAVKAPEPSRPFGLSTAGSLPSSSALAARAAGSVAGAATVDAQTQHSLAAELAEAHLDAAYRIPVAKYLQRRLVGAGAAGAGADKNWPTESATGLFPSAQRAASGELAAAVQSSMDRLQEQFKQNAAASATVPAGVSTCDGGGMDDLDAMLDDAFDELDMPS